MTQGIEKPIYVILHVIIIRTRRKYSQVYKYTKMRSRIYYHPQILYIQITSGATEKF